MVIKECTGCGMKHVPVTINPDTYQPAKVITHHRFRSYKWLRKEAKDGTVFNQRPYFGLFTCPNSGKQFEPSFAVNGEVYTRSESNGIG